MAKKTADQDKRSVNDAADQNQPWNKQFEDDRDDSGNLSRIATRKKHRGNSILTWVVWIALALVIIVPVAWEAIASNQQNTSNYSASKITVNSSKKKAASLRSSKKAASKKAASKKAASREAASKKAASKKAAKKAARKQAAASEASTASQTAASSQSTTPSSTSRTASSRASSTRKASSSSSTYTVKAGDNLYRIAVNHGMTLDQLLTLNGLARGATISAGQTLKVK